MSQSQFSDSGLQDLIISWSDEKCQEEASNVIPKILKKFVPTYDVKDAIQTTKLLSTKFLPFLYSEDLGKEILSAVFQHLCSAFDEVLASLPGETNKSVTYTTSELVSPLQDAIKIIQCLEFVLRSVISLISRSEAIEVSLDSIPSVPFSTINVLKKSYTHCKDSEECYGKLFKSASNALSILFQKTYSLQKALTLILSKLENPTDQIDEEARVATEGSVVEICKGLTAVCSILSNLDNTLLGTTWKLLLGFMSRFKQILTKHLSIETYIGLLCDHISDNLKHTVQLSINSSHLLSTGDASTQKALVRSCKLSQFFVASLATFLKDYSDLLSEPTCRSIASHLCDFYAFLKPVLQVEKKEKGELEAQFYCGISKEIRNILSVIIQAPMFLQFYCGKGKEMKKCFGYFLLLLEICQTLLDDEAVMTTWFRDMEMEIPDETIVPLMLLLHGIFECSLQVHEDLSYLMCGVKENQKPSSSLYDITISRSCGLISHCQTSHYPSLEKELIQNILSHDPCRSVMATDIMVFICRSSPSLCTNYFELFLKLLQTIPKSSQKLIICPRFKQVISVVRRIIPFLTHVEQKKFYFTFCKENPWAAVYLQSAVDSGVCESEVNRTFQRKLEDTSQKINSWADGEHRLKRLQELILCCEECVVSFYKFQDSNILKKHMRQNVEEFSCEILKLWRFLEYIPSEIAHSSIVVTRLLQSLITLSGFTVQYGIKNFNLEKILKILSQIIENEDCMIIHKICIAEFLSKVGTSTLSNNGEIEMSKIFVSLLSDPCWRVRHTALNSFEIVSRTWRGTILLEQCAKSTDIATSIESHLCRSSHLLSENVSLRSVEFDQRQKYLQISWDDSNTSWDSHQTKMLATLQKATNIANKDSMRIKGATDIEKAASDLKTIVAHVAELAKKNKTSKYLLDAIQESRITLDSIINVPDGEPSNH